MKKIFKSIILTAVVSVFCFAPITTKAQDDQSVTLQTFYDQLAPYGQWVNYAPYGNVFIPNAGPGFVPYSTNGHWEYTDDYGWTWDSDYPWGWACFHYGRWNYDASYGWFWIPDTQWGPAWVVWRNSDQYYGWAPLPWGVDINVGINNGYGIPDPYWCFVPVAYMGDPYIYRYYMPRANNDIFVRHTAIIARINYDNAHHFGFFIGPDVQDVERFHHGPVDHVVINFNADPHHAYGQHELGFYRPAPVAERHDVQIAPAHVVRVEDVPRRNVPAPQQHFNPQPQQQHFTPQPQRAPAPNRGGGNFGGGHHR